MPTIAILTQVLLLFLGAFLMIIVLLQRGRGGGLAGAFGGAGGQSAFGTKAGDVFTKITVVVAVAWVLVAGGSGYFLRAGAESRSAGIPASIEAPVDNTPLGEGGAATDSLDLPPTDFGELGAETPAADAPAGNEESPAESSADETTDTTNQTAPAEPPAAEGIEVKDPEQ